MSIYCKLHIAIAAVFLLLQSTQVAAAGAASVEQLLEIANEAYASGKYEEAIPQYREIIGTYGFSAEILHNLGNSYAGTGQHGQAILQYLRGLSLAPGNDDLQGSLEITRKNSGLFLHEHPPVKKFFNLYDMNQWALAALFSYIVFTSLLLVHVLFPFKKGLFPLCFLVLVFMCISVLGTKMQYSQWSGGIVIKSGVRLQMSPFPTALSQGMLDEGALVFTEKVHGKYHYVRDEKGRSGWVDSTSFANIKASHLIYSPSNAGL